MTKQTGVFAFPRVVCDTTISEGMTLRDYFAAKVLGSLLELRHKDILRINRDEEDDFSGLNILDNEGGTPDDIAQESYALADAMIRARK